MVDRWITLLCERLGVPVDDVDVEAIVDLATDTAHHVERTAAPVATFVAGYAAALRGGGTAAVAASVDVAGNLGRDWTDGRETSDVTLP